ncbi:MAG TPA: tripartite tricarboxylate transporter TctB family protein [Burkholderiales bacterium]|nr:tripartite tricarboxylate transporter TctB family protein [Burkholderiales bacterium]
MNKAETTAGALFTALGIFMLVESFKTPYLLEGVPGPAFLPRWIAIGLIGTGAVLTVRAVLPRFAVKEIIAWPNARGWWRVALMLGTLAIAFVVLDKLGFLVTTTLFIAVVIFGLGVRSWLTLASVPLLAATVLYTVFAVWLRVPLPKGILGFLG